MPQAITGYKNYKPAVSRIYLLLVAYREGSGAVHGMYRPERRALSRGPTELGHIWWR